MKAFELPEIGKTLFGSSEGERSFRLKKWWGKNADGSVRGKKKQKTFSKLLLILHKEVAEIVQKIWVEDTQWRTSKSTNKGCTKLQHLKALPSSQITF